MFCTNTGTKTQPVCITFPCMKQQISIPLEELSGEAHSEMCWLCLLSACHSSMEAQNTLCFPSHSAQHTNAQTGLLLARDPHSCQTLAWLHTCNTTSGSMGSAPASRGQAETRLQNCPQSMNCHARGAGSKGGALGFILTAQLRTHIKQHMLLQV